MKKKAAILLALALTFGAVATNANDNGDKDNKNNTEATTENKLDAPVITEGKFSSAARASLHENVSVFIQMGKDDPISGDRYAKAFANGFANREYTNGLPMYVTVVVSENAKDGPTMIAFFSDGGLEDYKGAEFHEPSFGTKLIPVVASDHVKENGYGNVIPETETPVVVASIN